MKYITGAATTTIEKAYGIRLEINKTLTGTVTIADGGNTVGVIAIGGTGGKAYYGFTGVITIVNSATEDITVSILNRQG